MKKMSMISILLLLLVVTAVGAELPEMSSTCQRFMERVADTYNRLHSYQCRGTITTRLSFGDKEDVEALPLQLAVEKPNKFFLFVDSPELGMQITSNGKEAYLYLPPLNEYKKEQAAPSYRGYSMEHFFQSPASLGTLYDLLMADKAEEGLYANVKRIELLGDEQLHDREQAKFSFLFENNVEAELWFDKNNYTLSHLRMDLSKQMGAQLTSASGNTDTNAKFEYIEDYKEVKLNNRVSEDVFTFVPSPEAKLVTQFAFEVSPKLEEKKTTPVATQAATVPQGELPPDFSLQDLTGKEWTLSQLRGKVVMLNFWAIWCYPCLSELPALENLWKKYQDRGFVLLGISADKKSKLEKMVKDKKLTYPILLDTRNRVGSKYKVRFLPTTILMDRQGKEVKTFIGAQKESEFAGEIEKVLK